MLDLTRLFCPHCNLLREPELLQRVNVSTEDSRDRALVELDRKCGVLDYAAYERRYRDVEIA